MRLPVKQNQLHVGNAVGKNIIAILKTHVFLGIKFGMLSFVQFTKFIEDACIALNEYISLRSSKH